MVSQDTWEMYFVLIDEWKMSRWLFMYGVRPWVQHEQRWKSRFLKSLETWHAKQLALENNLLVTTDGKKITQGK